MGIVTRLSFCPWLVNHHPIGNHIKADNLFFQTTFGIINSHRKMIISNSFYFMLASYINIPYDIYFNKEYV